MRKFKVGEEVVYHAGNWQYIVDKVMMMSTGFAYGLVCNDDSCEKCLEDGFGNHLEVLEESELISYDEWCDHGDECKTCHN